MRDRSVPFSTLRLSDLRKRPGRESANVPVPAPASSGCPVRDGPIAQAGNPDAVSLGCPAVGCRIGGLCLLASLPRAATQAQGHECFLSQRGQGSCRRRTRPAGHGFLAPVWRKKSRAVLPPVAVPNAVPVRPLFSPRRRACPFQTPRSLPAWWRGFGFGGRWSNAVRQHAEHVLPEHAFPHGSCLMPRSASACANPLRQRPRESSQRKNRTPARNARGSRNRHDRQTRLHPHETSRKRRNRGRPASCRGLRGGPLPSSREVRVGRALRRRTRREPGGAEPGAASSPPFCGQTARTVRIGVAPPTRPQVAHHTLFTGSRSRMSRPQPWIAPFSAAAPRQD